MNSRVLRFFQYASILTVVGVGFTAAKTAEAGDNGYLVYGNGYYEECLHEGCSREEREELYWGGDYDEECDGEGCYFQEKVELACSWQSWWYCGGSAGGVVNTMLQHWCNDGRHILGSDIFGNSFDQNFTQCN